MGVYYNLRCVSKSFEGKKSNKESDEEIPQKTYEIAPVVDIDGGKVRNYILLIALL